MAIKNIFDFLFKKSDVSNAPKKQVRVINKWEHNGWGNNIDWIDFEDRKIVGWLYNIPKVGDEFRAKMESGRIARFKIEFVNKCGNPSDMFFATLSDIGYLKPPLTPQNK